MRRLISFLLLALVLVLAACGGGDDDNPTPETTDNDENTPELVPVSAASPQVLFTVAETGDVFALTASGATTDAGYTVTASSGGVSNIIIVIDTPVPVTQGKHNIITGEAGSRVTIPMGDGESFSCTISTDSSPTIDVVEVDNGSFDASFTMTATECSSDAYPALTINGTVTLVNAS